MGKKVNTLILGNNGSVVEFGKDLLPVQKTNNTLDWVIFGDMTEWINQQPQYYDYLSKLSADNGAILVQKNRYVWGKGFEFLIGGLDRQEIVELKGFMKRLKRSRLWKRIIADRNKYGGYAVEMVPSKGGDKAVPHYVPFKDVRVSKKKYSEVKGEEDELLPTRYYFTSDWDKGQTAIKNAPDFTEFETWDWSIEKQDTSKRYLVYYKDEGYEGDAYPLPDYQGGISYIDADTEVGNFVKNNVKNGFTAGLLVQFYGGDPGDTQKAELEAMWKNYLHGSDNAGKAMMAWLDSKDESIDVKPLSANGQDDRYNELTKTISRKTFIAHTMSPQVVGQDGSGGFSNNADEKRISIEAFNQDYVASSQEPINDLANEILDYNGINGEVELQRLDPIMPSLSESVMSQIYGPEQLADIYGLPNPDNDVAVVQTSKEIIVKMSKEKQDDILIAEFEKCGILDEELEILDFREFCAKDIEDAEAQSTNFLNEKFATPLEESITRMLQSKPDITVAQLAELFDKTEAEIQKILDKLIETEIIDEENKVIQRPADEPFVVYKYEKRSDVSGPDIIDGTRDFCKSLVRQSRTRSWTIDEIKNMNNGTGLDVFRSRGGWKTVRGTNIHTPFCRHIWRSIIVRRKV